MNVFLASTQASDETARLIDGALYTEADFFNVKAVVPYPTAEARKRLADVLQKHPDAAQVAVKLAELDEKAGDYDAAEQHFRLQAKLQSDKPAPLRVLAEFYQRRARFADKAGVLESMIPLTPAENRGELIQEVLNFAAVHGLERYLSSDFSKRLIEQDPNVFSVVGQFIEHLETQQKKSEALDLVRRFKANFPNERFYFRKKEVELLESLGKAEEAEKIYTAAFDPTWPEEETTDFYAFLERNDRYKGYGHEVKTAFGKDPTDFKTALRLIHFIRNRYSYESPISVVVRLEQARTERGVKWKSDELLDLAAILIREGFGGEATRYLHTICVQGDAKPGSPLRAKVLYQLFETLMDAEEDSNPLADNRLEFYRDVAASDPRPGLVGAVLSLVLADADLKRNFDNEERAAVKYFNRDAAYRIFRAYAEENPTSPELAQMYLDLIRYFAGRNDGELVAKLLAEFEARFADAPEFPSVALKLADCYVRLEKLDAERALYRKILDHLGKNRKPGERLVPTSNQAEISKIDQTAILPQVSDYPPKTNPGIGVADRNHEFEGGSDDYGWKYRDRLTYPRGKVTYADVLARLVSSLAKSEKHKDIPALYFEEIQKYPDEPGLYEHLLQWLGQTKLADEQLRVYREALKRFPTRTWRDRLARWFIQAHRDREFETFSKELLEKLSDEEAQAYLSDFIAPRWAAREGTFDSALYLGLYSLARKRFPHHPFFVRGLLTYYAGLQKWDEWEKLAAASMFTMTDVRAEYLTRLAQRKMLRSMHDQARSKCDEAAKTGGPVVTVLAYKLFRADAAVRLSNYEDAVEIYRELNGMYPNSPEFADRLVAFLRSFGQRNRKSLESAATLQHAMSDAAPDNAAYRTTAGELYAELGDFDRAKAEWDHLITIASGVPETYLDTATVYWDYFQYDDAVRTIETMRRRMRVPDLYAYQMAALHEAKRRMPEALGEYVKALNARTTDYSFRRRSRERLTLLCQRPGMFDKLQTAFQVEIAGSPDREELVLGFAEFLGEIKKNELASDLLKTEAGNSRSRDFLSRARSRCEDMGDVEGQRFMLRRLIPSAKGPRFAIAYRLQLAETHEAAKDRAGAVSEWNKLVAAYPTNYGVLIEVSNALWRVGLQDRAVRVLRAGASRANEAFRYRFLRRIVEREMQRDRFPAAERILTALHCDNVLDGAVFDKLVKIHVRTGNSTALSVLFKETLTAIREQDIDVAEKRYQVADLRGRMIDAFTNLKDYRSAMDQHIEIINAKPEDEEKLDEALRYAERYGGADVLLDYYRKTAAQAYKNYRWNLILARIYKAKDDFPESARQYRAAIGNQPEMVELYDELADVCLKMNDLGGAIGALKKAVELTGDDPELLKRLIEALERAGRRREAGELRAKLPQPAQPPKTPKEAFLEAAALRTTERSKAIALYRKALDDFIASPFKQELMSSNISDYVGTVRDEDPLDRILGKLFELRDRLIVEADKTDTPTAANARRMLSVLDQATVESVGKTALERATGEELAALSDLLGKRIETTDARANRYGTFDFLTNLAHGSGLIALEERGLIRRKDAAASDRPEVLRAAKRNLANFHADNGDFRKALDVWAEDYTETEIDSVDLARTVDYARILGDRNRELEMLRAYYRRFAAEQTDGTDPVVERYFELLQAGNPEEKRELAGLAATPSRFHLQLINFLLKRNEADLARKAVEAATLPPVWKSVRRAEIRWFLDEFDPANEADFVRALDWKTVGETVGRPVDSKLVPVGDDWFALGMTFGHWSYFARKALPSNGFLYAKIENRPTDAGAQAELARWYLERGDAAQAAKHFTLALEHSPDEKSYVAALGEAWFKAGNRSKAEAQWERLLEGERPSVEDCTLYLTTAAKCGLQAEARDRLFPIAVAYLTPPDNDSIWSFEDAKPLLSAVSDSFGRETENSESLPPEVEKAKAGYFEKLCAEAPNTKELPEFVLREIVSDDEAAPFFRLAIERSDPLTSFADFAYKSRLEQSFNKRNLEETHDHERDFSTEEPNVERWKLEKEFLEYLVKHRRNAEAAKLIAGMEREIRGKYARPGWLRLAKYRLEVRSGGTANTTPQLAYFVGIAAHPETNPVKAPDMARLNDAVRMLKEENRFDQARFLLKTAYGRFCALGQYRLSVLAEAARAAFNESNPTEGLKILRLTRDLAVAETQPKAEAELMTLAWVKSSAINDPAIEKPEPQNELDHAAALESCAEVAAEFGRWKEAVEFRTELSAVNGTNGTDDEWNRLELIRLTALSGRKPEAVKKLAELVGDRTASRQARAVAVRLCPELIGLDQNLWNELEQRVGAFKDREASAFVKAIRFESAGRKDEALRVINAEKAVYPNPFSMLAAARLEGDLKLFPQAVTDAAFVRASPIGADWWVLIGEETPIRRQIRFFLESNLPLSALRLAESAGLKSSESDESDESETESLETADKPRQAQFISLPERFRLERERLNIELLAQLSVAAERVGQFGKAIEFEQIRNDLLSDEGERQRSHERLARLRKLLREKSESTVSLPAIDRSLVFRF